MQSASTHPQNSRSEEIQTELLRRRLNYVVCINFSFFAVYLVDQFVIPIGNAGIVGAAVFALFMAIRLYRIESAARSRSPLEAMERRSENDAYDGD